ncbi:MAG: hypothetical protein KBE16_02960 [Alphaproteobacteria bacterium]|jgi:agmatine/peptidylarginine deiminase|nr:hypothetical protein [Alphaproteobacteria bacterium]MBP9877350.1 hypothetical protein [Alphaproteobacteria bacterium]
MSLSVKSINMIIDLIEIKLSYMSVTDREDAKEYAILEKTLSELKAMKTLKQNNLVTMKMQEAATK